MGLYLQYPSILSVKPSSQHLLSLTIYASRMSVTGQVSFGGCEPTFLLSTKVKPGNLFSTSFHPDVEMMDPLI